VSPAATVVPAEAVRAVAGGRRSERGGRPWGRPGRHNGPMPADAKPTERPVVFVKGRGAGSNRPSRFLPAGEVVEDECVPRDARTVVTERQARSLLNRNQSPDLSFDHTINPYQGCEHGCVYCFARPAHAYHGLSPGLDFETRLFAKTNAAEILRAELGRKGFDPGIVSLGGATDAYQPIEREHRITRQVLEVLAEFDVAVGITTKSALVTRDLDLLAPMAAKGLARVHMSLPTLDHALSRLMDPRASSPAARLAAIRKLTDAGVPVAVYCAPIIPLINDHELEALLDAAADGGATTAIYTLIRLPREVRDLFVEWLRHGFPDRADRVMAILQRMHEGRDYDARFGKRMSGTGALAQALRERFEQACRRRGLGDPGRTLDTTRFRGGARGGQGSLF